jgi:uncharacterized membrane-anchored protein
LAPGGFSFEWMKTGHIFASLIFGGGIAYMLTRFKVSELTRAYPYWTMVALIRTAGTAVGDYTSKTSVGLYGATLVDGAIFIALLLAFYVIENSNQARNAMLAPTE